MGTRYNSCCGCCCCHHISQSTNQPEGCQSCSHDQLTREKFPCPRLRLEIRFRETGLAVPSSVSLLILYTNAESGAYSRNSSQCLQRCPYIFTTIHHRVSHDFIGSRNCVPMAFTAKSPFCPNIITAVQTVDPFPPPDLCLYKRRKFSAHGTVCMYVCMHVCMYGHHI